MPVSIPPGPKQGEQPPAPPKAKACRVASAPEGVEEKGSFGEGVIGGDADVFGAPAFAATGGDVGVDALVGGMVGAGDAAVVYAVEDAGGVLGFGVAAEGGLACDEV